MNFDNRFNNNFDFLRLFAALSITFTHSFDLLNLQNKEPLFTFSNSRICFSWIGLYIFFCSSGYLIAKSADTSKSIKHYIWKRVLRIQPLLIVWSLFAVLVLGLIFTTLSFKNYFSTASTWTYFRTILPLFGIQFELPGVFANHQVDTGVNGSLWTLIIEERLYLFIAFVFLFKKFRKPLFFFLVFSLNGFYIFNSLFYDGLLFTYLSNIQTFYSLLFLNSSLLYFLKIKFKPAFTIELFIASILIVLVFVFPLFDILKVYIIPYFMMSIASLKSVLNHSGKYGDFTYGIYIFSFPVQQIFIDVSENLTPFKLLVYSLSIVIPLSVLSWTFVEKKALSFKNHKFFI